MAEESTDQSQKTEDPTQKRLEDAREKGQIATSREVNNWFMILAATVLVTMLAPAMLRHLYGAFLLFVEKPHLVPLDGGNPGPVLVRLLSAVGGAVAAPIALLVMAAILSGVVQTGIVFAPDRIMPDLGKISVFGGLKRLFSLRSIAEFLKGLAKLAIVATVATMLLLPQLRALDQMSGMQVPEMLATIGHLISRLLVGVLAVITVIAALDFLYQKFEHLRKLRMSRQEIRDELKQTEGDPQIKQRLGQIRRERARRRMMAAVPDASVVIANPTHYAVALKYDMDKMRAPVLVAKGIDQVALRIRKLAEESGVPVVENPPVAQTLYAAVEIDEEIPPEHYRAVAEIIGYVLRLKGKLPARQGARVS